MATNDYHSTTPSLLKLLFVANHRWAIARGREGLQRELSRRAAKQPSENTGPIVSSHLYCGL